MPKNMEFKDRFEPVSRDVIERVAKIIGPLSAAQKVLDELDNRLAAGENVAIWQTGNTFVVWPAPEDKTVLAI